MPFGQPSIHFKRLFLSTLLVTFPLTTLPRPAYAQLNVTDGLFFYNIEKAVEKLLKAEGKGTIKKYIEAALDIKEQIEQHFNMNIDLSKYLDDVEREVKKQGHSFKKGQFKQIKNFFIKDNKKRKNHKGFLACAIYDETQFPNYLNESLDFHESLIAAKSHDKNDKKDKDDREEEKIEVPATLVYGVTVSLVGFFIMLLPFPGCNDWGKRILFMGLSATGGCLSSQAEKNKQEEKDKNKK